MTHHTMTLKEWALLLLLSFLWGGSFMFNHIAVAEIPVFLTVAGRVITGSLLFWLFIGIKKIPFPKDFKILRTFLISGFLASALPFSLIVWAQASIASSVASILNATTPLFTLLVAHFMTEDEKLTPLKIFGILTGLLGVCIFIGIQNFAHFGKDTAMQLAVIGASFSYACAAVYSKRFRAMGINPIIMATGTITSASLLLLPLVLIVQPPWAIEMPGFNALFAVLALGFSSTFLAYIIFFRLLSTIGSTNLTLVTFLVPVSAVTLGIVFLHESLQPHHFWGVIGIATGLVIIDGRVPKLIAKRFKSHWIKAS